MNAAYSRYHIVHALDNYAFVIVLHVAMTVLYPHDPSLQHWQKELRAFSGILRRYNRSKMKKGYNLIPEQIYATLADFADDPDSQEQILDFLQVKGLALPETIDWEVIKEGLRNFTAEVTLK